ncbi:serine hydrolase domain-containing protein [Alteromonas sp. H39]|uniref:serine hydrolase domain-containing protein n=1 Tax=Alteromonas sp. H39 TaxID=3389876 RepID=UPI0039E17519
MRYFPIIALYLLLVSGICVNSSAAENNAVSTYSTLVQAYHDIYGFSGTVKVVEGNGADFEKCYGLANRSFRIPNTVETRISVNSISKTFTATAVLILVEEGAIDIQAAVGRYLPSLTASWKDKITVHHLLTHTSGLPRESGVQAHEALTFEQQITNYINTLPLLFSPGEQYEYSNAGITLLGAIIENVTKDSYANVITSQIITPLGLKNTGVYQSRNIVMNQAEPYRFTRHGIESAQRSKHWGDNAGGALYSTPSDLHRYVSALKNNKLLSEAFTALLFKPHIQSGSNDYEGYAWSIKQAGDDTLYFAAGSGYGTKSVMIQSADTDRFIAITSNWGNTPVLKMLGDLYMLSVGQSVTPPNNKTLAHPKDYAKQTGQYYFDAEAVRVHLGMEDPVITLQSFEGKLFLNDELLSEKDTGVLGLTYTEEFQISFKEDTMRIVINGNVLEGKRR